MPKLDKKMSKRVAAADPVVGGDFEPLPAGKYAARLSKVEVRPNPDKYGQTQWAVEYDQIHDLDGEKKPGRQFQTLTIPGSSEPHPSYDKSPEKWEQYQNMMAGRLAAFFEAFGFTADSDTDEMVGEWALLNLRVRTIESGDRKGQKTNEVNGTEPVPDDWEEPEIDEGTTAGY